MKGAVVMAKRSELYKSFQRDGHHSQKRKVKMTQRGREECYRTYAKKK